MGIGRVPRRLSLPAPAIPAALAKPRLRGVSRREIETAAAELGEELRPLPIALGDIARKIRGHCARRKRGGDEVTDAALAAQCDGLRERLFALSLAVWRLAEVARPGSTARTAQTSSS